MPVIYGNMPPGSSPVALFAGVPTASVRRSGFGFATASLRRGFAGPWDVDSEGNPTAGGEGSSGFGPDSSGFGPDPATTAAANGVDWAALVKQYGPMALTILYQILGIKPGPGQPGFVNYPPPVAKGLPGWAWGAIAAGGAALVLGLGYALTRK